MDDLVFIGAAIMAFGVGIMLVNKFKKTVEYLPTKQECPPHAWKEYETAPNSGIVFLRCKSCNKTLREIFGE